MTTQTSPVEWSYDASYWRGWPDHPEWGVVADYNVTLTGTENLVRTKLSNDVGEFTPGVYRINTYEHSSEKLEFNNVDWELTVPPGYGTAIYTASGEVGGARLSSMSNTPEFRGDFGNLGERALLRAYSNVAKNIAGMGENLGELAETIRMLRSPFKGIRDYLYSHNHRKLGLLQRLTHYLNTGKWKGMSGNRAALAAADGWLEFRYGFMPLARSVQDIIDLVNSKAGVFDPQKIRCAKSLLKDSTHKTIYTGGDPTAGYMHYKCSDTQQSEMQVNASVQYLLEAAPSTYDLLGLTPRFIPELIWDLTRLSFVVDWWLEIGPWLGAYRITPQCTILGNTVGYKDKTVLTHTATEYYVGAKSEASNDVLGTYTYEGYRREVNAELAPLPQVTSLNPLDLFRAIDLVMLIYQPLSRDISKATRRK